MLDPQLRKKVLEKLKYIMQNGMKSRSRKLIAGLTYTMETDDIIRPPANSLMLAEKIPGAWLVQIKGGGHGVMYQYPNKFSRIVLTFLET